jgi:hypothetical protein
MADTKPHWEYWIEIEHRSSRGELISSINPLEGPHGFLISDLEENLRGKLEHLPADPAKPEQVRLKLILTDET